MYVRMQGMSPCTRGWQTGKGEWGSVLFSWTSVALRPSRRAGNAMSEALITLPRQPPPSLSFSLSSYGLVSPGRAVALPALPPPRARSPFPQGGASVFDRLPGEVVSVPLPLSLLCYPRLIPPPRQKRTTSCSLEGQVVELDRDLGDVSTYFSNHLSLFSFIIISPMEPRASRANHVDFGRAGSLRTSTSLSPCPRERRPPHNLHASLVVLPCSSPKLARLIFSSRLHPFRSFRPCCVGPTTEPRGDVT